MGIETLIGAGLGLIGSSMESDAASDAADTQAGASRDAIAEQRRQYDLTRQDFAPWRTAGQNALGQLAGDINAQITPDDVMSDPGYQFGLDQGQQAIDRKIAAGGGRISGAAIKAAGRFGTNYATSGYNAAYQRRQDRLNRLAELAGIGQTATGASALAGAGSANAISGLLSSQGDAAAASQLTRGNIWGNAGNQIAAMFKPAGTSNTDRSTFRYDDPYRNPWHIGGDEGE